MERKGDKIVSLVCFTLIALTFMKCCIVIANTQLEADQKVNLVADEVKAEESRGWPETWRDWVIRKVCLNLKMKQPRFN